MCNDAEELSLDLTAISEFANGCFGDEYTHTKLKNKNAKMIYLYV